MVTFKVNPSEFREKVKKCQEYIGALDEERKKIQVFERELPLCLELVSQAIERCRQEMSETITEPTNGQSMFDQYSDQTSSELRVFEEFIPMKSTSSTHEDIDDELSHKSKFKGSKDWLASAQLSIQVQDPTIDQEDLFLKKLTMEEHKNGCDKFVQPFRKNKIATSCSPDTDGGSSGGNDSESNGEDKGRCNKKERRCWSPELHRRFLHALQQLGGAHVATPKHIKELMKVNGLTTDEIKSHLQKYRLHIRRLNPTIDNDDTHVTPQLVVVGRIWMPPLSYATNATSSPQANDNNNAKAGYAPMSYLPQPITASSYKTNPCH